MEENGLPLGILKQAVMKLDSCIVDLYEAREEVEDESDKLTLTQMIEISRTMVATIVMMVSKEIEEEDFMNENIEMDEIENYPS